jgi:decaprenylphospho-beta-D-ribofuranose 2-oxidase
MRGKNILLTNFSRAVSSKSFCLRPDTEQQLADYTRNPQPIKGLARGSGLSYSDSCLNKYGSIIDMKRLNHLISFDARSGIAVCQAGTTFQDLFLLHPDFIPPVLPGTLDITVGGGIAHDIHGKNNHHAGSFGNHILEFHLLINGQILHCSREKNAELFYATIAGLGLTGIITRVSLQLKKATRFVEVTNKYFHSIDLLTEYMTKPGLDYDYQVAWIDLLNGSPRAILSLANHCETLPDIKKAVYSVPSLPFGFIKPWNIKLFNKIKFRRKKTVEKQSLISFNNPLDTIKHWNRLYGSKGLIQFQAVFDQQRASSILKHLFHLISIHKVTPTLVVLKLFTKSGSGLLSFCQPGFTLAIDFIHTPQAKDLIKLMNHYITDLNGKIYLAKDLLLTAHQYQKMYQQEHFSKVLHDTSCTLQSDLSQRLGITQ